MTIFFGKFFVAFCGCFVVKGTWLIHWKECRLYKKRYTCTLSYVFLSICLLPHSWNFILLFPLLYVQRNLYHMISFTRFEISKRNVYFPSEFESIHSQKGRELFFIKNRKKAREESSNFIALNGRNKFHRADRERSNLKKWMAVKRQKLVIICKMWDRQNIKKEWRKVWECKHRERKIYIS